MKSLHLSSMEITKGLKYWMYKISSLVFGEVGGTLGSVGLVLSNLLRFLYQVGVQEAREVVCMLFEYPFLFLLDDANPEKFDQPLLLNLSLFLLFCLSILLELDLPKLFDLPFVLLFLHSFLLAGHLV